jgi:hypothetical protein
MIKPEQITCLRAPGLNYRAQRDPNFFRDCDLLACYCRAMKCAEEATDPAVRLACWMIAGAIVDTAVGV